ncbi:MAG: adenylate kinase [Acholeplasmataceae bacterium]|jgi:adenylate kinase
MRIIIMGPPGAGKGTEAEVLIKHFQIPHISTGNIFRELYRKETEVGKIAKEFISRGELVPDDITNAIVKKRLSEKDVIEKGFLFDGYPRNIEQAEALDQMLTEKGWTLDAVINITAPDETIVKRIAGRRVCETCGAVYHIEHKKPKVEGVCDIDGGKLIHRNDDKEKTVQNRLSIYHEQTKPIIGYYKETSDILHQIDGTGTIDNTHALVMKALGETSDSN